jgi:hypothetical protein
MATTSPSPMPPEHPAPHPSSPDPADDPATGTADTDTGMLLFTPAQAAAMLQVRESWLRRRVAQRRVPCSFLGKHLRFSPADLAAIVTHASVPAVSPPGRARRSDRPRP